MTFDTIDIRGFEYLFSQEAVNASGIKNIMAQIKALFPGKTNKEILDEVNWSPVKKELKAFFLTVHSFLSLKEVSIIDLSKLIEFGMLCVARLQIAFAGSIKRKSSEEYREFAITMFQKYLDDDTVRTYPKMINEIMLELTLQTKKVFHYNLVKKWLNQYKNNKLNYDIKDGLKVRPHFLKEIFK